MPLEKKNYILASILSVFQILDGTFTHMGVSRYGVEAEGNPIIKYLIEKFGATNSLFVVKFLCVVMIIFLCKKYVNSIEQVWLFRSLSILVFLYATLAIIPWSYILLIH